VDVGNLRPWPENPRKNDGEPVRKVAASIKRYGFGSPIIARRANGEIIAGHTRYKAAQKLGLDKVPVRYLDLDPADAHLLAVADNRVAEEANWDDEKLAAVLGMLQAEGLELADTGFAEGELNRDLAESGDNDAALEWAGMPECESEDQTAQNSIIVNFANHNDMSAFATIVGQTITDSTRSIWYPKAKIESIVEKAYEDAEP